MAVVVESQVEALYTYSYDAADGRKIAFNAGEKFTLLSKANDDWWHVKRNGEKPMYVPANYVREVQTYDMKTKQEDKLVQLTTRSNSTPSNIDNNGICTDDDSSVFRDNEIEKSECNVEEEKPRVLSPGIRSLAKSLQNTGVPLRGSISTSRSSDRPKSQSLPVGWVIARDEETGRAYYYNAKTSETSWKPPRVSRFIFEVCIQTTFILQQDSVPVGWHIKPGDTPDELLFYNEENDNIWGRLTDDEGKVYYYKLDGSETAWELPQIQSSYRQSFEALDVIHRRARSPNLSDRKSKSRSLLPMGPRSSASRYLPPPPDINEPVTKTIQAQTAEKQALFNRKKIANSGNKKIKRPSWSSSFVAQFSSNLVFYKDQKAAQANEEDSSVVGSVQEKTRPNSTSGYESDDDDHSMPTSPTSILSPGGIMRTFSKRRVSDDNKSNIKDKLLKFITRRPTIDELEKQGILKEQTFGCPIQHLCEREKTIVPNFVTLCIQAIERKGLTFDGLYRVCGNVALVQRIRISVDQEDSFQLGVKPFDDVHALTGSLKLYFRELPEPLVPFDFFSGFVEAIKQNSRSSKLGALKGLVGQLPKINYETLKRLLRHLDKVMKESEANRMHAQNLAIVWGPNMMRPRYEAANMAMNMVYQNQIIEFLLLEFVEIFK
ncbi:hypothetical protein QZH41_013788 [Actinostola sp. cb2023]|nr:hypothetical protein QZH41_013788 [Actinostola sp. cb2023]